MAAHPADIVDFWRAAGRQRWFKQDDAFDAAIRLKFEPTHHAAARGEYDRWIENADGALALLILLDQFPRNLYRGSGHAFATDPKALRFAGDAVERGHHRSVAPDFRQFFYLPFEHSEDLADQARSVALCELEKAESGDGDPLKWALVHRDVIVRFGRFPHRNRALGRVTTALEQAFLDDGGFTRMSPDLRRLLISFTVVGAVALGFVWGFARLPPWALAPPLAGLAWAAAWMLTARYNHDRPALIGGFIALFVFYAVGAYIPDLILNMVLD